MNILQKIFSIKNNNKHKIITILGIKIKLFNTNFVLKCLGNDICMIKSWQNNFNKEKPTAFPMILTQSEQSALIKYLKNSKKYLEFGSGGSTFLALLHSNCDNYTVESDENWLGFLRSYKIIDSNINKRLNLLYCNIGEVSKFGRPASNEKFESYPDYSQKIYELTNSGSFDLAFVDGRFRVACVLGIILNCDNNINILVHDYTKREHYHIIEKFLDIVEIHDTLAIFKIKNNIDKEEVRVLYDRYKYNYE